MEKERTTKVFINHNFKKIIEVGYCDLQLFLKHESPKYYTRGIYGWNADIYTFGDIALCTGYRPFGNIKLKSDVIKDLENKSKTNNLDVYKTLHSILENSDMYIEK